MLPKSVREMVRAPAVARVVQYLRCRNRDIRPRNIVRAWTLGLGLGCEPAPGSDPAKVGVVNKLQRRSAR